MSNILEIKNLSKAYGQTKALNDVTFNVEKGAIYGLLGPNGAGKTTILRIINSILVKDSGDVRIDGKEASLDVTSSLIGYMPEERGLYPKMNVSDQIIYFGLLKGADMPTLRRNMHEYMNIFNISKQDRHRRIEELSKGNQQKVQIIATIVHEPKLIILDEPFSGFDPINGQLLQSLIERLQEKGATIMLSSHNMPAIEQLCSHIALINKGRLLLTGKLDELRESHRSGALSITTAAPINENMLMDSGLIQSVNKLPNASRPNASAYEIMPAPGATNNNIIEAAAMQASILAFEEILPSLSDIFLNYTSNE